MTASPRRVPPNIEPGFHKCLNGERRPTDDRLRRHRTHSRPRPRSHRAAGRHRPIAGWGHPRDPAAGGRCAAVTAAQPSPPSPGRSTTPMPNNTNHRGVQGRSPPPRPTGKPITDSQSRSRTRTGTSAAHRPRTPTRIPRTAKGSRGAAPAKPRWESLHGGGPGGAGPAWPGWGGWGPPKQIEKKKDQYEPADDAAP